MRLNLAVVVCGLLVLAGCGGSSSNSSSTSNAQPPVANSGGPYTGTTGTAVSFNGSGSSDPRGQVLTYAWYFGDGATGTGASPTHIYPVNGYPTTTYTVSLTVTDTSGLTGTAGSTAKIDAPPPLADGALTGVVSSGTIPIAYAHVYLFAANTTGYGQASVSLLSATETGTSDAVGAYVPTAFNGTFKMTGDYTCSSGQQLYVYVLGGDAGTGQNALIGLMAAIGSCPSSTGPGIGVTVNEVSTIAAAYAMAGFAMDATHVSSSGTTLAQVGVANAFANASNLASLSTGAALATTPAGNGTVPQQTINALANTLADCINLGRSCSSVLSTATSDGTSTGTIPTDTATAAINIAHNPGANVATLYGLGLSGTPYFSPALLAQPNDWTLAVKYTGGGLDYPLNLAVDASGNIWVLSHDEGSLSEFNTLGVSQRGNAGITSNVPDKAVGLAIDPSGDLWVSGLSTSMAKFTGTGNYLSTVTWGCYYPGHLAIDSGGDVYGTDEGPICKYAANGTASSFTPACTYGVAIAIDGAGNVWMPTIEGGNAITEFTSSLSMVPGEPCIGWYDPNGIQMSGVAIDAEGDVWAAGSPVTEVSSSGSVLSGSGYAIAAAAIAIDGNDTVWTTGGSALGHLAHNGTVISPSTGYTASGLAGETDLAVDTSGNIWTLDVNNYLVEWVGLAAPVTTPLVQNLVNNPTTIGQRP